MPCWKSLETGDVDIRVSLTPMRVGIPQKPQVGRSATKRRRAKSASVSQNSSLPQSNTQFSHGEKAEDSTVTKAGRRRPNLPRKPTPTVTPDDGVSTDDPAPGQASQRDNP